MKKHSIISNQKVAKMSDKDIDRLMEFPNIVHNRKKLEAIVSQARGYLQIEKIIKVLVIFFGHMLIINLLIWVIKTQRS